MRYFFIIIFSAAIFSACDLFETRDAERPNQPRSNFQQAATPEILISNLINSFIDKNTENYLANFVDSSFSDKDFVFSPSVASISLFPALSDGWSKKSEEQYFNTLMSRIPENSSIVLSFIDPTQSQQGDSLFYNSQYSISISFIDENIPENYQGELQFRMIRDSRNVWVIYFWQDNKNSDLPSWSELKGRFY